MPHRKRMSHAYVTTENGTRELCIYYGAKEVSFDEERLFAFGEQLVSQSSFVAESATSWGPGYESAEVPRRPGPGASSEPPPTRSRAPTRWRSPR